MKEEKAIKPFDEFDLEEAFEITFPMIPEGALKVLQGKYSADDLTDPVKIVSLFEGVKNLFKRPGNKALGIRKKDGVRKITLSHIKMAIGDSRILDEEIARRMKTALLAMSDSDKTNQLDIWNTCSAKLKYSMCITKFESFDMDLFEAIGMKSIMIFRSFVSLHALRAPTHSPYTTHYVRLDYDTGEKMVQFLEHIPKDLIMEFLTQSADFRFWYLLASEEVDYYLKSNGGENDFFVSALYNDQVPLELPLVFFLQETCPEFFKELVWSILDQSYVEFRDMFYQQHKRETNKRLNGGAEGDLSSKPGYDLPDPNQLLVERRTQNRIRLGQQFFIELDNNEQFLDGLINNDTH